MRLKRFATAFGMAALAIAIFAAPARAGSAIEDILYEKGQITKDEWVKAKAAKEKEVAETTKAASSMTSKLLKGVELKATFYFDYTNASGNSFTGDQLHKGINTATANNNRGLTNNFHFTRTYLTLMKTFDEGHHFRLTLDQMVNNIGGGSNCTGNGAGSAGGNCSGASPFGLSGYAGGDRNSTFVKYAYYNHVVLPGLEVRVGQHQTPWVEYEEHRWTYRFRGPIMVDEQGLQTSSDLGVSVLGKVLDKKIDYHLAVQSGEGYQNTQDGRGMAGLGRISVEPIKGAILSGFYHNERSRNGVEGFNPQRALGNVEVYDPESDRFKVNAQFVWADDGNDVGKLFSPGNPGGPALNMPGTYTGNADNAPAATLGGRNGPATGTPRFRQARGYEFWGYARIPGLENTRFFTRYYFMKPNKETPAGDNQSIVFGVSYDYSKYLSVALDYTLLQQTVLGSDTTYAATHNISTGAFCGTCGQFVNYNNQIFGVKILVAF